MKYKPPTVGSRLASRTRIDVDTSADSKLEVYAVDMEENCKAIWFKVWLPNGVRFRQAFLSPRGNWRIYTPGARRSRPATPKEAAVFTATMLAHA